MCDGLSRQNIGGGLCGDFNLTKQHKTAERAAIVLSINQLVTPRGSTTNQGVGSSNLSGRTSIKKGSAAMQALSICALATMLGCGRLLPGLSEGEP